MRLSARNSSVIDIPERHSSLWTTRNFIEFMENKINKLQDEQNEIKLIKQREIAEKERKQKKKELLLLAQRMAA